jgi:Domain of unknown function (DUF6431)
MFGIPEGPNFCGAHPASRSKLCQETVTGGPSRRRDSFYRTARAGRQDRAGVTEIPLGLLPRRCPLCGNRTIIGHGRRLKQAHDERHAQIRIRRGRCRPCQKTFTVLPDWSPPSGIYSLHCRQQAWELSRPSDSSWERSIPDVADAARSPDPSTVRRWAGRLLQVTTLLAAKLWQATGWSAATSPTILAWDWSAIRRILPIEARSP